jgi:transmembrane sensor
MKDPVAVRWTAERTDRVVRSLQRRQRRSAAVPLLLSAVVATCVGLWLWRSPGPTALRHEVARNTLPSREKELVKPDATPLLQLHDGSTARRLDANTSLQIKRDEPLATVFSLPTGRAFFDVVPHPGRVFRVEAGPATVEVVGTAFTVGHRGDQVEVQVTRGHVRVLWLGGQQDLLAGEQGQFPPLPISVSPVAPPVAPSTAVVSPKTPHTLATTKSPSVVPDRGGHLLAQADAAQLSGQRTQALAALRRFQSEYATDRRVGLAAFTEGRLLLALGQAAAAARTFRRLQEREPQGPLHEDALAREVQAWDQAQDVTAAHRCAEEYLRTYPHGSRRALIAKHGHLQSLR